MILNYNGIKFLKNFIGPIVENSPEATIYVIDNGSTDNSVSYLKKNFPKI